MELNIKINETVGGDLFVKELAYEEGAYASSVEEQFTNDTVLFSESASVTVLKKVTTTEASTVKAYVHNHQSTDVSNKFKIESDGWYEVMHLVVPDSTWLQQAIEAEYLSKFDRVFIMNASEELAFFEYVNEELVEIDVEEVLDSIYGSNLWLAEQSVFVLFDLWQCYLNYCKKMLEGECSKDRHCPDCNTELNKNMGLVWIFLNAIQYLVKFGEFQEAQEFLEDISGGCNTLCANEMFSKQYECGCS